MSLTLKQRVILRTLKDNLSNCKVEYINAYQDFYIFYIKMLDKYDCFDDINYVDRERLLHLANESRYARENFEKSMRAYFNCKICFKEEDESFIEMNIERSKGK